MVRSLEKLPSEIALMELPFLFILRADLVADLVAGLVIVHSQCFMILNFHPKTLKNPYFIYLV